MVGLWFMCTALPLIADYKPKFHLNPISSCLSYLSDKGVGRTDRQSDDYMPAPLGSIIKGMPQLVCVHF